MKVLVTGADGFVGRYLLAALAAAGHEALPCYRSGGSIPAWASAGPWNGLHWHPLELGEPASVEWVGAMPCDAVIHLAALSSGRAGRRDPGRAWEVNAAGTARFLEVVAAHGRPRTIVVSTGEVYGSGPARPRTEGDPTEPVAPYAASKLGSEIAAGDIARRAGLPLVIARPFAHTGPGQSTQFVAPAFVERLRAARADGAPTVTTGNLEPVRDLLDVRDVVSAYIALLDPAVPAGTYNIARGEGTSLAELFRRLAQLVGVEVTPVADPALVRAADVPHLVGDATRLQHATGWRPERPLDQTLQDLVNAEAH